MILGLLLALLVAQTGETTSRLVASNGISVSVSKDDFSPFLTFVVSGHEVDRARFFVTGLKKAKLPADVFVVLEVKTMKGLLVSEEVSAASFRGGLPVPVLSHDRSPEGCFREHCFTNKRTTFRISSAQVRTLATGNVLPIKIYGMAGPLILDVPVAELHAVREVANRSSF